jgi:hypothetical protein
MAFSEIPTGANGRGRTATSWDQRKVLFWVGMAVLAAFSVFVLPLLILPPQVPSQSSSYTIGFSNRVATLSTVFLSAALAVFLWWKRMGARVTEPADQGAMPRRWLGWASLATILFTALWGGRVGQADVYYCDTSYFLTQLGRHLHDHGTLYKDFEFAYGPLLFYWPLLFIRVLGMVGLGARGAYMVSLGAMQVLGVGVVFYLIERLPLTRRLKGIALATLTFGTCSTLLGLNYTMFRFALPYAVLLWVTNQAGVWRQALFFALGEALMLGVSPELGVAFAGGAGAYGLYRAVIQKNVTWLSVCTTPLLSFALTATVLGRSYFEMMMRFAGGAFSGVIDPRPHLEILLTAAILLSPFAIAGYVRRYGPDAGPMIGLYIAAMGMIPAGLGRCDELHTFFAGVGVLLLSLVAVSAYQNVWSTVWVALFAMAAVYSTTGQAQLYWPLERQVITGHIEPDGIDVARLEAITGDAKIAAPVQLPLRVREALIRDNRFAPSYYCTMINAQDVPGEERKIQEMQQVSWILVEKRDYRIWEMADNRRRFSFMRLGYDYKPIRTFYSAGMIRQEIQDHWTPVEEFGEYILYRKNQPSYQPM